MAAMAQAQALYAAPIQYDPAVENRTNYVERLEAYFDASRVRDNGRKRSILISAFSPEVMHDCEAWWRQTNRETKPSTRS